MRKTLLLAVLVPALALAHQDMQEIVPAPGPISKHVLFLVDSSSSMAGDSFERAVSRVQALTSQAFDEWEFCVLAFSSPVKNQPGVRRWGGVKEAGVPAGWCRLPSQDAVDAASNWLRGEVGGNTHAAPAMAEALREARMDLTVVLLTDGFLNGANDQQLVELTRGWQVTRQQAGWGKARIFVLGYGRMSLLLKRLAEENGGGYYLELPPPVAEDDSR